jgi:hypothetical protein
MTNTRNVLLALIALAIATVALWYGWYQYVVHIFPDAGAISESQAKIMAARGQLGDLFGGINALFTSLLLAGALYTVFLQQRQLAAMQAQHAEQERESKEIARLQAMTALVAARSTIVQTRYEMMRDMAAALNSKTVDVQFVPVWQVMAFKNAEAAGEEFKSLDDLAERLNQLVEVEDKVGKRAA